MAADRWADRRLLARSRPYLDRVHAQGQAADLGGGELGDGLGALGDSVLRELAGEHEPDRSLDLSRGEGLLLAVAAELGRLESDALEDVIDEGVHDRHALRF